VPADGELGPDPLRRLWLILERRGCVLLGKGAQLLQQRLVGRVGGGGRRERER
jgi:hypothetical protein